jgi:N-acetylglutamate synthase-like GNAT family acetyltransferase
MHLEVKMKIRKFKDEDAQAVCKIINKCDKEIASKDYSKKIINWWIKKLTPDYIINKSKNRVCYVACLNDKVVGYISLDGNEIKKLHVNPKYHRIGIGTKLIQRIEYLSIKNRINKLIVESSIYAERFYKKFGFIKVKINHCEHDGEKFKLILMEKKLKCY